MTRLHALIVTTYVSLTIPITQTHIATLHSLVREHEPVINLDAGPFPAPETLSHTTATPADEPQPKPNPDAQTPRAEQQGELDGTPVPDTTQTTEATRQDQEAGEGGGGGRHGGSAGGGASNGRMQQVSGAQGATQSKAAAGIAERIAVLCRRQWGRDTLEMHACVRQMSSVAAAPESK